MAHHFNHERHIGNAFTRTLALGAFLISAAVTAEKLATDEEHKKLTPEAKVNSTIREGDKAIYIVPGCRTNGHYIGGMIDPFIADQGSTHHLAYPEKGFSLESVKHALLEARALDDGRPATIYASSMGGMVTASLLSDPEFRAKFGQIDKVVFDSSPADNEDLDSGTRKAMVAASIVPPSWTVAHLYRAVMKHSNSKRVMAHSADISDDQAIGHGQSSASTHLSAVEGQAHFIDHTKFAENQLKEAFADVGEVIYIGSSIDHTVNQETALQKYVRAMGRSILRVIDWDREEGSHASGPEFPRFVANIIASKNDRNQPTPDPEGPPLGATHLFPRVA
jgi:hypothetical protein